MKLILKGMDIV